MDIQTVGKRGVIFTFDDNISVYLIAADKSLFLCDSHLGPRSMEAVRHYIRQHWPKKEIVLFNSHADWDHIWGNCAFPGALIIGHEQCRARIRQTGQYDLERLADQHRGEIVLVPPNLTFSAELSFPEEEVSFIHAPGHTADSALCFDRRDTVLFVGDLVEAPIPYLDFPDLARYIKTLEIIKHMPAKIKISAHSGIVDEALIDRNIAYIRAVLLNEPVDTGDDETCKSVHNININNLLLLQWERVLRDRHGENFNYLGLRVAFPDWETMAPADLSSALESYAATLKWS